MWIDRGLHDCWRRGWLNKFKSQLRRLARAILPKCKQTLKLHRLVVRAGKSVCRRHCIRARLSYRFILARGTEL